MKTLKLFLSLLFVSALTTISAQNDVTIKTIPVSNNVYMLVGQGGNIGVSVGDDGVFVIDDQFAQLTPKILAAIKKLSDKSIQFVVNTHYHGDHTGGNANMEKAGAKIIAHDNVYKRLSEGKTTEGLPVITFNDKLSVHMNGEQVLVFHVDNAHTDGDAMLYFTESNVLHTGDNYFHKRYPYIDVNSGGSIDGYIDAVKMALMVIDENTKIIPGHGDLSNKAEYAAFLEMLTKLRTNVQAEIDKGKTEAEVVANTAITKEYDVLNYSWSFINSEKIRRAIYKSLTEKK
ncbi:MBL fold metallo-hydrolase [Flavobacteriaceae bacterium S0825]|uniref:MBL fold metallo-hydrolase n=1 Tax=Gaetbulibacter sp. S0825 TaxID=2720084 RepID=UPI0014306DAC|nr:MBL fold metallo-hydrolase [Gaetbulibacter sp. S0825]MCK0108503.1 MBL fold metallo-hydrolase [Flavobacteriaceae bacterium S0825]NIX64139.1 MBL fold metallo-hydrolase [Gaetbulibacter sp. S0825]